MAIENLTRASELQKENRKMLVNLFEESPISKEEQLINLGLYMRSSYLASVLFLDEMYKKILNVPGVVMEFGVWWGANLTILQSLRGVYEPYNYTRKVIGFDTFQGYPNVMKDQDKNSKYLIQGNYSVSDNYEAYLSKVMDYHELENVMSHKKKYELVKGDITVTLPAYLERNAQTIISMVYFDLGLYEPTKKSLEAILPYLTKGSLLVFDELNFEDMPGETIALREILGLGKYRIERSNYTPDRCYLVVE
jgi:hypothetical protein